jgi:hypothetical protein
MLKKKATGVTVVDKYRSASGANFSAIKQIILLHFYLFLTVKNGK